MVIVVGGDRIFVGVGLCGRVGIVSAWE